MAGMGAIPQGALGPVMVLNAKTQRQTGREAQIGNIHAARAVADIIRTTLGPRSMLKMLLDPMGGIVMTNDGHCILREVDVSHPTAKSMIELSRSQDEEVGDGTTSVIILAAEMLILAEPLLRSQLHPTIIVQGYNTALQAALDICNAQALHLDINDDVAMTKLVTSCMGTKFSSRWNDILVPMAIRSVLTVARQSTDKTEVDIKRYAKVEKIPGGEMSDCEVLDGVMFNKDVTHAKMRRRIENPRILLIDSPLEYKKGESQTNVEITNEEDWSTMLRIEEEYVENLCAEIIAFKPDIVCTEKGVSDLAQHFFHKAGITVFRRLRKSDNNRVARATGATIVSRTDEIQESDIGTKCGLFEMRKIGDEYFCYLIKCEDPKACTIVLRGGSKDVLNEMERNLTDAMQVVRNVVFEPKLLPGGGATEMAVGVGLMKKGEMVDMGVRKGAFQAVGKGMEVIPRTLAENCGVSVIRTVTQLRAKHAEAFEEGDDGVAVQKPCRWGVNGVTGKVEDMDKLGIWEPYSVKVQTIKTAIESACMILRIDDIVSGTKKK
eukprot:CAMPEP_0172484440 /NCGR_PEP_ID=MMETSP1066-20121228/11906_1 /TAXON_ID=671091 /ORGANISM="Coscinodiscus wailesii, Strain CCMP2513" /LENGTH=549 /DNA_ID=CAMNT_0013248975 /DNA_START=157 /DNA_END=1806 /DNA_ORIENTATION=+